MPYRDPAPRLPSVRWRVTWWQKRYVQWARWLGTGPFAAKPQYLREYRRYERRRDRWLSDSIAVESGRRRPRAVPPVPPPVPVLE